MSRTPMQNNRAIPNEAGHKVAAGGTALPRSSTDGDKSNVAGGVCQDKPDARIRERVPRTLPVHSLPSRSIAT